MLIAFGSTVVVEQTGRSAGRGVSALALIGACFWTLAATAQAPDDTTLAAARQLGQQGVVLYEQGDYASAHDKLDRAYALVKMPTLGLWSARALVKLGRLVEALQRYREVTLVRLEPSASELLRNAQTEAQREYDALEARLPQLTVVLAGASPTGVTFRIDGKDLKSALIGVAVPIDPGVHAVEALRGSDVVRKAQVTLAEGEQRSVTLDLPEPTPEQAVATAPVESSAARAPASAAPESACELRRRTGRGAPELGRAVAADRRLGGGGRCGRGPAGAGALGHLECRRRAPGHAVGVGRRRQRPGARAVGDRHCHARRRCGRACGWPRMEARRERAGV